MKLYHIYWLKIAAHIRVLVRRFAKNNTKFKPVYLYVYSVLF